MLQYGERNSQQPKISDQVAVHVAPSQRHPLKPVPVACFQKDPFGRVAPQQCATYHPASHPAEGRFFHVIRFDPRQFTGRFPQVPVAPPCRSRARMPQQNVT